MKGQETEETDKQKDGSSQPGYRQTTSKGNKSRGKPNGEELHSMLWKKKQEGTTWPTCDLSSVN